MSYVRKNAFRSTQYRLNPNLPGFSVSARRIEKGTPRTRVREETRLNGERFSSIDAAKRFAETRLPVYCQLQHGGGWVERIRRCDTVHDVEAVLGRQKIEYLVMRPIGETDTWKLSNPRLAALGFARKTLAF